jgi:hypothetical protein
MSTSFVSLSTCHTNFCRMLYILQIFLREMRPGNVVEDSEMETEQSQHIFLRCPMKEKDKKLCKSEYSISST